MLCSGGRRGVRVSEEARLCWQPAAAPSLVPGKEARRGREAEEAERWRCGGVRGGGARALGQQGRQVRAGGGGWREPRTWSPERLGAEGVGHQRRLWRRGGLPVLLGNSGGMRGNGLQLCQGRFRLDLSKNVLSERAVMHCDSCPGRGDGVTVPGGVKEPWRCGTEGRGQWAWRAGWAE